MGTPLSDSQSNEHPNTACIAMTQYSPSSGGTSKPLTRLSRLPRTPFSLCPAVSSRPCSAVALWEGAPPTQFITPSCPHSPGPGWTGPPGYMKTCLITF